MLPILTHRLQEAIIAELTISLHISRQMLQLSTSKVCIYCVCTLVNKRPLIYFSRIIQ